MQENINGSAAFIEAAIQKLGGFENPASAKVLDFGCGKGELVQTLLRRGYDMYGCDTTAYWLEEGLPVSERLSTIPLSPYRLPFAGNTFDVVISTSVLEHAQNKEDFFREIHRVLRPGGFAMHLYPGKWYLPYEPHIYVPLANFLWPHCPAWWLGLWALLGVRNEFQKNLPWQSVAAANQRYCREGLSYWTTRQYRELSLKVYGNCRWPMRFYINHSPGGFAHLFKRLPFKGFTGLLSREIRMGFMLLQKSSPDLL
jgi:SAM-dependent methyltransferase